MFAAFGSGELLPCYVVYKAQNMYDSWATGGPPRTRKLPGKKILIGDNSSSHLPIQSIEECFANNISFIFLPSNSTLLTQPSDVAFFRLSKCAWRKIVEQYKRGPGRRESGIPKNVFSSLMRKLLESIEDNRSKNIIAGFEKCGIIPSNADKVLNILPVETETTDTENDINASFIDILKSMRYDENQPKPRKKKLQVPAGKSVAIDNFESSDESDKKFSNHDSNLDMDPMSDQEEAFDKRYDAAEEVISPPTFNGTRVSNNSPQESVSNSVLIVTKNDVNIGTTPSFHE
ncbi:hypothetical protein JTB14_004488 [Gonioctena quinquepunctata]|nr:hypothetical protein JTB14_004488 [Gonioctena quinquepunctata]